MSKRGMRGMSMRVRVGVAAAVLAGGGAAGAVVLSAGHDSAVTAQSAGFIQSSRTLSYSSAISSAMKTWDTSPSTSLRTLTHMQQINNYWSQSWHHHTLFFQRGKVVAVGWHAFVVRSANGMTEVWHTSGGTAILNVGGTSMGMDAMTGGSVNMRVPSWWAMNTKTKGLAKGDLVFVFGERENHTLKAQLVLFAAPTATATRPAAAPTATPTAPAPTTTTAPAVAPAGTVPTVSGTHF
jgi:hypothetical protein